jgi:hypothetical protein
MGRTLSRFGMAVMSAQVLVIALFITAMVFTFDQGYGTPFVKNPSAYTMVEDDVGVPRDMDEFVFRSEVVTWINKHANDAEKAQLVNTDFKKIEWKDMLDIIKSLAYYDKKTKINKKRSADATILFICCAILFFLVVSTGSIYHLNKKKD